MAINFAAEKPTRRGVYSISLILVQVTIYPLVDVSTAGQSLHNCPDFLAGRCEKCNIIEQETVCTLNTTEPLK